MQKCTLRNMTFPYSIRRRKCTVSEAQGLFASFCFSFMNVEPKQFITKQLSDSDSSFSNFSRKHLHSCHFDSKCWVNTAISNETHQGSFALIIPACKGNFYAKITAMMKGVFFSVDILYVQIKVKLRVLHSAYNTL